MKIIPLYILVVLGVTAPAVSALAQKPPLLLDYPFDDAMGLIVKDRGPSGFDLKIGSAMTWSAPGAGLGEGPALLRTGDGDVYLASDKGKLKALAGLRSFTLAGWYKFSFDGKKSGVLFELEASEGNGFRLHFAAKPATGKESGTDQWLGALVSVIAPKGANPHTGTGVLYSPWTSRYNAAGKWTFFAVSVDAASLEKYITFYMATEGGSLERLGVFRRPSSWPADSALGKIVGIRMGNSLDMKTPIPVGIYLGPTCFYGSIESGSGALGYDEINHVMAEMEQRTVMQ